MILTAITPLCYITMINILIPSVMAIIHMFTVFAQMLTLEDYTCHDLAELYTLAALSHDVGSRSNGDHELLCSPYKYTCDIEITFMKAIRQ